MTEDRSQVHTYISLRDWFAGHALPIAYAHFMRGMEAGREGSITEVPALAYQMADALITEREKNKDGHRPFQTP